MQPQLLSQQAALISDVSLRRLAPEAFIAGDRLPTTVAATKTGVIETVRRPSPLSRSGKG